MSQCIHGQHCAAASQEGPILTFRIVSPLSTGPLLFCGRSAVTSSLHSAWPCGGEYLSGLMKLLIEILSQSKLVWLQQWHCARISTAMSPTKTKLLRSYLIRWATFPLCRSCLEQEFAHGNDGRLLSHGKHGTLKKLPVVKLTAAIMIISRSTDTLPFVGY